MFIALLSISVSPEVLVPSSPAPAIPSIEREKIYVCCPAFMFHDIYYEYVCIYIILKCT